MATCTPTQEVRGMTRSSIRARVTPNSPFVSWYCDFFTASTPFTESPITIVTRAPKKTSKNICAPSSWRFGLLRVNLPIGSTVIENCTSCPSATPLGSRRCLRIQVQVSCAGRIAAGTALTACAATNRKTVRAPSIANGRMIKTIEGEKLPARLLLMFQWVSAMLVQHDLQHFLESTRVTAFLGVGLN